MTFQKHYSREEASALLPQIRVWLTRVRALRCELEERESQLSALTKNGWDLGGEVVNSWLKTLVGMEDVLAEFRRREVQIKDIDRGLIDFPAILNGKEVFLCWEDGEEDIEFWHELDAGYAGRERL